ncbi:MAG TPA: hypothetical protein VG737_10550 [Cyclobacteriaceae bacterium]|nr:hypothetical protein [Cyclobacteriaceae bacterium]
MKAGLMLAVVFALVAGSASAQELPMAKNIMQEEVPVSIVKSLQNDLNVSSKGQWRVHYDADAKTSAHTVRFYVFTTKSDGKKIQVFYNPDGTVDHAKGVTVPEALASKK